jgi:hypothetical protein
MILRACAAIGLLIVSPILADPAIEAAEPQPVVWQHWQPLIGTWKAQGKGSPGQGEGTFSFGYELQNRVIVRKSHTDYPPANGHPAFAHDDLLIIHFDDGSKRFRADYFDNEGHVIRYTAEFSTDGKQVTFVSDPAPAQPSFRLTYAIVDAITLNIKFEIAPPNAPDQFKVYLEGTARRQQI